MTQDVRKTLVVLSQIKTAIEVGISPTRAVALAMESPSVSVLFSDEAIQRVIKNVESGTDISVALSTLDILSEYDQALIQAAGYNCNFDGAISAAINQHMFIRSLGV